MIWRIGMGEEGFDNREHTRPGEKAFSGPGSAIMRNRRRPAGFTIFSSFGAWFGRAFAVADT
jgi:hypothetical protein